MKISDESIWNDWKKDNQEPYGKAIIDYAERWANLMEKEMYNGVPLEDIAEKTSHDADAEGITGFMYGASVLVLASCWEHGEQLRRWHNLATQIHHEGEKANETGAVLNPALLNIGQHLYNRKRAFTTAWHSENAHQEVASFYYMLEVSHKRPSFELEGLRYTHIDRGWCDNMTNGCLGCVR